MGKTVKCGKCGWYHFERSRDEVVDESISFHAYINKQTPETQAEFGIGPLSRTQREYDVAEAIKQSERCFQCGASYKDFVDDDGLCPTGVTIQGIINRNE